MQLASRPGRQDEQAKCKRSSGQGNILNYKLTCFSITPELIDGEFNGRIFLFDVGSAELELESFFVFEVWMVTEGTTRSVIMGMVTGSIWGLIWRGLCTQTLESGLYRDEHIDNFGSFGGELGLMTNVFESVMKGSVSSSLKVTSRGSFFIESLMKSENKKAIEYFSNVSYIEQHTVLS